MLSPPGLWWVEVSAPQLPVEALSRQRVLLDLKRVVLDVVKGGRHHARPVLLYPLQDGLCPAGRHREQHETQEHSLAHTILGDYK